MGHDTLVKLPHDNSKLISCKGIPFDQLKSNLDLKYRLDLSILECSHIPIELTYKKVFKSTKPKLSICRRIQLEYSLVHHSLMHASCELGATT